MVIEDLYFDDGLDSLELELRQLFIPVQTFWRLSQALLEIVGIKV